MQSNQQPGSNPIPPPAIRWFKIYCISMAVIYLLCTPLMPIVLQLDESITGDEMPFFIMFTVLMTGGCALLAMAHLGGAIFRPHKWVWTYGMIIICLGLMTACTLIAAIPLIVAWLKPETKAWFGERVY